MKALGNKTAIKLLKIMASAPLQEFKEIELIKKAKTGKGSANLIISELVKDNILVEQRAGKTKIISINLQNPAFVLLKSLFDQKKLENINSNSRAALILFKEKIRDLADMLVVFGSSIAGTATEKSDVDILVVSTKLDDINKERKQIEELFDIRFNLHSYSADDLKKSIKQDRFAYNALATGAFLCGYDLAMALFADMKESDGYNQALERLLFFDERIKAAFRNYLQKDPHSAKDILEKTVEQILFYLLAEQGLTSPSKKDAYKLIKQLPEAKIIQKINKAQLKDKIALCEELVMALLKSKILRQQ
ncbi:nucleotidyltransferase domain-containing protein [Candidatus Woesearchaeota archaeon]|nr:nucleotidyltransferase domain-containing protein [Candidatus Woesearchaeota archaeon]